MIIWIFLVSVSYLIGSIPFGLLISKSVGLGDLRTKGSGNIGATNMLRVGGKRLAALTLVLDALKGAIPVIFASFMMPEIAPLCALIAVLGHIFPAWLRFKGGKGVATFLGALLALSPLTGVIITFVWIIIAIGFKYSSLSALVASALAPVILYIITDINVLPVIVAVIIIFYKHRTNIKRLMTHSEPKIGTQA